MGRKATEIITVQNISNSEYLSNDFIHINNCGYQRFSGISAGSKRLNGRIDYHILYISKGICRVTIGNCEIKVSENSFILYLPGQPQIYFFEPEPESVSYYIHFSGINCKDLLQSLNLYDCKIIKLSNNLHLENILERMVNEFNIKKPFYELACNGLFIDFLTAVARKNQYDISMQNQNSIIYDICKIMHERYTENIPIHQYAQMVNLSVSRFIHIFTEAIGVSPKQYLLKIKLEHAMEMILNTDLTISQISDLVGIYDCNYFSRLFKKHTGHSPGFYRFK